MHGVLRHYTLKPKDVDEVVRRIAEGGVPIIKAIPGFASYGILDAGGGKLVTYGVYESKMGTDESTKRAATWVKEHIASLLPTPPHVLDGEVRVREIKGKPEYSVIRRYQVDRATSAFVPLVNHLPGCATYTILDAGKGVLVTISGFATRAGADDSTKKAAAWVKENLQALAPNPPEITAGKVRVIARATD